MALKKPERLILPKQETPLSLVLLVAAIAFHEVGLSLVLVFRLGCQIPTKQAQKCQSRQVLQCRFPLALKRQDSL